MNTDFYKRDAHQMLTKNSSVVLVNTTSEMFVNSWTSHLGNYHMQVCTGIIGDLSI